MVLAEGPVAFEGLERALEEGLVEKLSRAIDEHKLVEIEYLKPEEQEVATRTVEPYFIERSPTHAWFNSGGQTIQVY